MKYWNKDKEIRKRHWIKVDRAPKKNNMLTAVPGGWARWPHIEPLNSTNEIKRWCQQQSSTGKFYHYYGTTAWWFEHEDDALLFKLRWL